MKAFVFIVLCGLTTTSIAQTNAFWNYYFPQVELCKDFYKDTTKLIYYYSDCKTVSSVLIMKDSTYNTINYQYLPDGELKISKYQRKDFSEITFYYDSLGCVIFTEENTLSDKFYKINSYTYFENGNVKSSSQYLLTRWDTATVEDFDPSTSTGELAHSLTGYVFGGLDTFGLIRYGIWCDYNEAGVLIKKSTYRKKCMEY